MDSLNPTTDAELQAADDKLKALEVEQAADESAKPPGKTADTIPDGDRAPAGDKGLESPAPDSKKDAGTPLTEEVETAKAEADKEGKELALDDKGLPKRDAEGKFIKQDKKTVEPAIVLTPEERTKFDKYLAERQGSKYAKDFNRRLVTWSELNAEKDKLAAAKTAGEKALQGAIAKFNADVQTFQAEKAQATPSPEKYEAFAAKQTALANEKELEARKLDDAGDFAGAEKLRDEAKFARRDAQAATASAEHVRKNPPPNQAQQQEKFTADQRTWIGKAAQDFPEFGKKGSELQATTAEVFKAFTGQHPEAARLPGLIYYCVRLAAAESSANRVPALDKELGELRTKVKDLEVLTNPAGGGAPPAQHRTKSWDQMSSDEQYAQLQAEASQRR